MYVELEKMQFLGFCEIFEETSKLIHKWRKIFTQIALSFILPLPLLILVHVAISNFFLRTISLNELALRSQNSVSESQKLSDDVSSERVYNFLFNLAYFLFSTTFSLLSTSAVVYTVACIYTARDVSFKQVTSAAPKVWKRLLVTFLCVLAAFFALNILASIVLVVSMIIVTFIIHGDDNRFGIGTVAILLFFIISYLAAVVYLTIIWQLSSVVSVLEDSCGFKAMKKSKELLKGKMVTATSLLLLLSFPLGTIQLIFQYLVLAPSVLGLTFAGVVGKGILGIIWIFSFLLFFLIKLVVETVLYFVCKSYHHESIDKSELSDHLQGYLQAGYVPLDYDDDAQLKKLQVV